jgi:hypothetical protein
MPLTGDVLCAPTVVNSVFVRSQGDTGRVIAVGVRKKRVDPFRWIAGEHEHDQGAPAPD